MDPEIFNQWNEKKKQTDASEKFPHFSIGEIWWAQIGQNISTEVAGKGTDFLRPIVIIQKVYGNACMAIPLTSKAREGDYYYSFRDSKDNLQCALLTQVRYLDAKRLRYKQSDTKKEEFDGLICSFQALITKTPPEGRGLLAEQTSIGIITEVRLEGQIG